MVRISDGAKEWEGGWGERDAREYPRETIDETEVSTRHRVEEPSTRLKEDRRVHNLRCQRGEGPQTSSMNIG